MRYILYKRMLSGLLGHPRFTYYLLTFLLHMSILTQTFEARRSSELHLRTRYLHHRKQTALKL